MFRELNDNRTPPALSERPLHVTQCLNPKQGFDTMRRFFEMHANLVASEDYTRIARDAEYDAVDAIGAPISKMWPVWLSALETP